MIELLRRVRDEDPDRVAVITAGGPTTYGALAARAEALAAGMCAEGIDRFAVVTYDVGLTIAALAAASLAGAEACVYAPDIGATELTRQAHSLDHTVLLTTRGDLGETGLLVTSPDDLECGGDPVQSVSAPRPHLVLTTGTTSARRGARHDWGRLLRNAPAVATGAGERWMLVHGPNQFAGLQVMVHVVGVGATLVVPPVRRPKAVMNDFRDHGVTHLSATPTFWRFLLAELREGGRPVPSLRQVTLGGEVAPASLLDELSRIFPEARITHVYAGAEFGSAASVSDRRSGLPLAVLERDAAGVNLTVQDGQLLVCSRTSMIGYYGEDDRQPHEWWPTGDLVKIVGDRIEFRGRASDVLNVGGVKVHPLPVEECVAGVDGVLAARAYGRVSALVGVVVAVDIVPRPGVDLVELKRAVRAACADLARPAQPRVVRIVKELDLLGGKTVRGVAGL